MDNYNNLEIYGVGNHNGGRFGRVIIAGSGKITGSVECECFELPGAGKIEDGSLTVHGPIEIDGAGKVEGSVRGENLKVNGSFKVEAGCEITENVDVNGSFKIEGGPCVISGKADVSGSFKVEGDLSVGSLDVDGSFVAGGSLRAGEVEIDGVLKVGGELQAECFRADGVVNIDGLLNAETVELSVSGEDLIESIGGGRVTVERGRSGFSLFGFKKRPHLVSDLIEADEISLEYTDCRTVRGINVHIGKECVIDRVEYSGTLTTDPDCTVREKIKVEPGPARSGKYLPEANRI